MSDEEKKQVKQIVKSSKQLPIVMLTALKPAHQQQIWRGMQKEAHEASELLTKDQDFKALKDAFNGRLVMDRTDAERYYKAGKK